MTGPAPAPEAEAEAADLVALAAEAWGRRGWAAAVDAMASGLELHLAARRWQSSIDRVLRPFCLNFSSYELLMRLLFAEPRPCGVTELGAVLQVHPTSVSNSVAHLQRSGHVHVAASTTDARRREVSLSPRGRADVLVATTLLNDSAFGRLPLPGADVDRLLHVLRRFRANAGDF